MLTLLDGFVDEPACLGVPPYISPYARYIAGAIKDAGEEYEYMTIEEWRKGRRIKGDVLVILAGAIVPGRYLRGMPISFKEFREICENFKGIKILVGAAAKYGFGGGGGKDLIDGSKFVDYTAMEDGDAFVYDFLNGSIQHRKRSMEEWKRWSILGAEVAKQHPDYPLPLIAEIETYRGCVRWFTGGCSFCVEPLFGEPIMRDEKDIINEVKELRKNGVVNFRLGAQSCFFSYKAKGLGKSEVPQPNPDTIKRLLEGIVKLNPKVLHIDNVNPAVVAEWEEESRKISELIIKYCTPGNTAAFGMESADEKVIKENNLNSTPEQVMNAVRIINEVGKERGKNGMPYFLPGINIIYGLKGECKETYAKNYRFLKRVLEKGYLLRRINIRQVANLKGWKMKISKELFKKFKRKINEEINKPMLEKLLPKETVLKEVYLEINIGNKTFGRQIGSYPILVCLPYKTEVNKFTDVKVLDHSYRSITALEYPIDVNAATFDMLKNIPFIGEKRAAKIIRNRPFNKKKDLLKLFEKDVREEIAKWTT
ncbi:MAG: radical SAM protein [Thermoplasmata archaeon]|nr:MAG: radical SAM protein [Thermoplasmata archaeon]